VLGVLDVLYSQVPSETPSTSLYFLLFIAASILLNCFLTFIIARQLMKQQRSMFGGSSTTLRSWHSTVITVMVESATAWVVAALFYLVTLLIRSRASFLFEYLFQITAVSSLNRHSLPLTHRFTCSATRPCRTHLQSST
jgi:hypothetical protein